MSGFNNQPQSYYSDDCCGGSVGSDEDLITDYLGVEEMGEKQPEIIGRIGPSPLVPTISVTPHSPAGKNYPILEDNLDQLHYIHESVQQMRDLTLQPVSAQEGSRLSASCPSLNEAGSDPDLLSSLNSTPTQTLTITTPAISCSNSHKRGSGEWELYKRNRGPEGDSEVSRRRSWAALEDLSHCKETVTKTGRHRSGNDFCSISLSSMESDMEDPFCKSTTNLLGSNEVKARVRQVHPNSSTHSLNEADLQSDFKKIVSKREGEVRLLNSHLSSPLQKSVSTPSIIAVRELANAEIATIESSNSTLPVGCRGFATESDEDENLATMLEQEKHLASSDYFTHAAYDKHPEKRRKRGSLFFRKKKDKTKKSTHHWVSVCYGNAQSCDLCSKSLMNKSAVFCEICEVNVHQNSCRDNIADCKGKGSKIIKGSASFGKSSNKRGSNPNQTISPSSVHNYDDHHYRANQHDNYCFSDEVPLVSYEFLDEPPLTVNDLDTDPFLGLQDEEPDSWTPTVTKEIVKKLKEKEVKRQEHLYEFILTEKHHCLTLRVMQKVFVEGLQKYLQFGSNVQRIFPRLADLTEIHLGFLHKLRARQREAPVIETIGDILEEQFSGPLAERLKSVYGEFCSNHRNAIDIYKDYMQNDSRFSEFVKHCQGNPLLKKKGIPECILFVTQRLTKYPLLIEPLIKTTKDNKDEQSRLVRALSLIKEILVEVDAQVAEKEKEDRKIEIYNKLEPKSFTLHRGQKFKKTDLLGENRKLRFEGIAMLMQGRGKMQVVLVIVFSDVLCFLLENSNKYSFFTPENKAGVISLQKLLVREKAGQESRGIYLISSNPADPEMFELKVHNPKDKQVWIKAIRAAVQECPEDDEDRRGQVMSAEEKQKQFDSKQLHMKEIVELLRLKDREQAQILEEKMALHLRLLATAGVENVPERPDYLPLVSEQLDNSQIRKDVLTAVKKVNQLAKSLYASATNLSRSASSVGERQSETYISPTLPKRAETFGGFDNQPAAVRGAVQKKHVNKETNTDLPTLSPDTMRKLFRPPLPDSAFFVNEGLDLTEEEPEKPHLLTTSHDHQLAAIQLSHHVYTLSCIISQQMTKIDSLKAELASLKTHVGDSGKPIYRHNQQLEELRNLQDKLQSEKEIWQREKESEMKELEQQREELFHLQEQIRLEQADITQQREKLYRKLEALNSQGILMGTSIPAMSPDDTNPWSNTVMHTPPSDPPKRKSDPTKWKQPQQNKSNTLPLNLISATNQQKVASNVQIKQQLPLKLASKLGGGGSSPGSSLSGPQQMLPLKLSQGAGAPADPKKSTGYQRLSTTPPQLPTHSRTGSSPAMMQNIQGELKTGAKAGRTNTYPKLPDKFKIRSSDSSEDTVPANNSEEEVIFF